MLLWASSEIYKQVDETTERSRHAVETFLNTAFAASSLDRLQCKLRYVPIVMPPGMPERYPARSKLRRTERICVCAPRLHYEVVVAGSFEDQPKEYLRGIALAAPIWRASAHRLNRFGTSSPSWPAPPNAS